MAEHEEVKTWAQIALNDQDDENEEPVAVHTHVPSEQPAEQHSGGVQMPPMQKSLTMATLRVLCLVASFVLAFFSMLNCHNCRGDVAYGLSVGVISMAVILVFMFLDRKDQLPDKSSLYLTSALLLWWTVAAFYLTNFGHHIFVDLGNAYCACWVAWATALMMCHEDFEQVKHHVSTLQNQNMHDNVLQALAVLSTIQLFAAFAACVQGQCHNFTLWAMLCGSVSLLIALLAIRFPAMQKKPKILGWFFLVWWAAGALTTFTGPFKHASNGYIATWAAVIVSLTYALDLKLRPSKNFDPRGSLAQPLSDDQEAFDDHIVAPLPAPAPPAPHAPVPMQPPPPTMPTIDVTPTRAELSDHKLALARLWDLDTNRLIPNEQYTVELGRGKKPYMEGDRAESNLFQWVDPSAFEKPTYKAFIALLDNYERLAGIAENITNFEKQEQRDFLKAAMQTAPMQYVKKYLIQMGKTSESEFQRELYTIWFKPYRRVVDNDSSGFEHVFVGEEKDGQVMGMHNWIQLYLEEQAGRLDYKGFIYPRDRSHETAETDHVLTIQFSWNDALKPISTSFVGVSPEFELALYTLCYMLGEEKTRATLGEYDVEIVCYRNGHGKYVHLGTSYPEC